MYSFASANVIGKWAVERIAAIITDRTQWGVTNVEEDQFYRSLDVDLVCNTGSREPLLIEVKGDRYTTGNIYIETISNRGENTPGCLLYTAADYVVYYFVRVGYALWIPVPELKNWIAKRVQDFPKHNPTTASRRGKKLFDSEGHTVPVKVLLEEVPGIYEMHFLEEMVDGDTERGARTQ